MVYICIEDDCEFTARYNYKYETIPKYCLNCKIDKNIKGMISLKNKNLICKNNLCIKRANFNFIGETKAIYCAKHKDKDMVNILCKLCEFPNCKTRPCYNFEGKTKPIRCLEHILPNMIDVINKKCEFPDCKTQPSYNLEGETKPIRCLEHILPNMINIISKLCEFSGCKTQPSFNYNYETKPIRCKEHILEGMIDIINVNKKCEYLNCNILPSFNYNGETKPIRCLEHILPNMINIICNLCEFPNCRTIPNYNLEGETKPIRCKEHMLENMIDVRHNTCIQELCIIRVDTDKYKGYCSRCFIDKFPDEPITRNYKTKEIAVVDYIKKEFPYYNFITDKQIRNGKSRYRPDILLDLKTQVLIIEIDENQHNNYDDNDEDIRLIQLSQDLKGRPLVYIKFNPDGYKINDKRIKSCWKLNKQGKIIISENKIEEWNDRLEELKDWIECWLEFENTKTIEVIKLFYDTI